MDLQVQKIILAAGDFPEIPSPWSIVVHKEKEPSQPESLSDSLISAANE